MKSQHPAENCKDLRTNTDKSIESMFKAKRTNPHAHDTAGGGPPEKKPVPLSTDFNSNETPVCPAGLSATVFPLEEPLTGVTLSLPITPLMPAKIITIESSKKEDTTTESLDVNSFLSKLSPLSQLDENTIAKLERNIEEPSKLTLDDKVAGNDTKADQSSAISILDNETLLMDCNSLVEITTRFQEFEHDAEFVKKK